jgi:hypothetical protein
MLLTYVIRRKLQLLPRQVEPKSIEKTHRISGNQTRRDAFRKWKLSASTVRIVNYRSKQTDTQRVRFNFHDSTLPPPSPFDPQTENLHLMRATGTVTALNDGETWELRERRGIHSIDPAFREKMGKKAAHSPTARASRDTRNFAIMRSVYQDGLRTTCLRLMLLLFYYPQECRSSTATRSRWRTSHAVLPCR